MSVRHALPPGRASAGADCQDPSQHYAVLVSGGLTLHFNKGECLAGVAASESSDRGEQHTQADAQAKPQHLELMRCLPHNPSGHRSTAPSKASRASTTKTLPVRRVSTRVSSASQTSDATEGVPCPPRETYARPNRRNSACLHKTALAMSLASLSTKTIPALGRRAKVQATRWSV